MAQITLVELSTIFNKILQKLEYENYNEIILEDDLYRYIPTDKWSSFEDNEIEIGSLYDDINSLLNLQNNKSHPCTYVDFDRLASVLRAISQKHNPPEC
jgi:hypothetical protein